MNKAISYQKRGEIALLLLKNAPVNALSKSVREGIDKGLKKALSDSSVQAILISSRGKLFSGGADIQEFKSGAEQETPLPKLLESLDASSKLTVAAINGTALGGGLELTLACHYRFAHPKAQLGLPEVHLGILPGAGGTQRLPRYIGVEESLKMIVSGKSITAAEALQKGLVHQVATEKGDFLDAAIDYTKDLLKKRAPLKNAADITVDRNSLSRTFFQEFRASLARKTRGFYAPERCIQAVESAIELPFKEGLKKENDLFRECLKTPQARAQQHLFFAERQCGVIPEIPMETKKRDIQSVGIIGSGTMGGGIAMNFLNAGIPVIILDMNAMALDRGLEVIRMNYEISVKRGRLTQEEVDERMALITGGLSYDVLKDTDLVIEAVFEDMEIKKKVFAALDRVCKPGCILASNTSTLDLNTIAAITSRPEDVIGLHFFSPANVMRLLEIVRGEKTTADVIVTVLDLAKRIKKIGVLVKVCFGFVGNRMLEPYSRESHRLLLEGATVEQVDRVLYDLGLAMGPFTMYDLAGIDVGYMVRESRREEIALDPSYCIVADKLYHLGRYGQKTKRGYYKYEGRDRLLDPELNTLIEETAEEFRVQRRTISDQEVLERCLYPLINEGARILEEGIAIRSGDIDIIWCNGYGFPTHQGGPMQLADETGLNTIYQQILFYRDSLGEYGSKWFQPSALLEKMAKENKNFSELR